MVNLSFQLHQWRAALLPPEHSSVRPAQEDEEHACQAGSLWGILLRWQRGEFSSQCRCLPCAVIWNTMCTKGCDIVWSWNLKSWLAHNTWPKGVNCKRDFWQKILIFLALFNEKWWGLGRTHCCSIFLVPGEAVEFWQGLFTTVERWRRRQELLTDSLIGWIQNLVANVCQKKNDVLSVCYCFHLYPCIKCWYLRKHVWRVCLSIWFVFCEKQCFCHPQTFSASSTRS